MLTIVADPPWRFGDNLPGPTRGAARNYPTMTPQEIIEYMIPYCQGPNVRLFLWRVASMVEEAYQIVRALGLVPKTEIVWLKRTPAGKEWFGMGRTVRASHEVCIIAQRGQPGVLSHSIRSTFAAPVVRHSQKPEAFFDLVEQLSPGPYVELFPRDHARPGWARIEWANMDGGGA